MMAGKFSLGILAIASVIACSTDDSAATDADSSAQVAAVDTPGANVSMAPEPGTGNAAPVTVADIEKWERGMAAELQAVQAAGEKFRASKTGTDSVNNMMGSNEMSTLNAGAAAAGLNPERYKFVRSTLSQVALALHPLELDSDLSSMPGFADQLKAQGAQNLERMKADAPPEVVEAMRPRALQLRKQHTDLVAARLRAAGMVQ
jgi:hypothetical protein